MKTEPKQSTFSIITVVGARPQFVKAAALSPELIATGRISERIVHTGQHFDHAMSDIFFEEMSIPKPHYNLGIGGGTHGQNTGRMIEALENVFTIERPDAVLVYGDTDSTLAAAIAASKLGIFLAHVESGLRSYRRAMPEEINRVVTDHVSDVLYCSSTKAARNLTQEGLPKDKISTPGDVMFDVALRYAELARSRSTILRDKGLEVGGYHLLTLHRKENVDDAAAVSAIFKGLSSDIPIVFLIHPRTAKRIAEFGISIPANIRTLDPVGYIDMLQLIGGASMVITDSGGLQKEAYFMGKPCVTLRDETEWVELVEVGANVLTGTNTDLIRQAIERRNWVISQVELYGMGRAARLIAEDLLRRLEKRS